MRCCFNALRHSERNVNDYGHSMNSHREERVEKRRLSDRMIDKSHAATHFFISRL